MVHNKKKHVLLFLSWLSYRLGRSRRPLCPCFARKHIHQRTTGLEEVGGELKGALSHRNLWVLKTEREREIDNLLHPAPPRLKILTCPLNIFLICSNYVCMHLMQYEYQGVKQLTSTNHIVYNSEVCLELKRSYFSHSIFFNLGYQNGTSTARINFD